MGADRNGDIVRARLAFLALFAPAVAHAVPATWGAVYSSATIPAGTVLFSSTTPGAFSYTVAPNAPGFVNIEIYGAGGSGRLSNAAVGGGGGGGAYVLKHIAVTAGTTVIAGTVGTPGQARVFGADGNPGTATTVTSPSLSAGGGGGGVSAAGGAGGTASGGDTNTNGSAGTVYTGGAAGGPAGGATQSVEAEDGNSLAGGGAGGSFIADGTSGNGASAKIIITAETS